MGDRWMHIGGYDVCPWSISGVETCVVVKADGIRIAFDMGYSLQESVGCDHVFISHGHMDHISGVVQHAAKRALCKMKAASYYIPDHLVETVRTVEEGFLKMAEKTSIIEKMNIIPVISGQQVDLPRGYYVEPFLTVHCVKSNGYLLYKKYYTLKEEYQGVEGRELSAMKRNGIEIHDITTVPEVAYMGDTKFDVFHNPPIEDILKVKLLITETTYIDTGHPGRMDLEKLAKERGHSHLFDFITNEHLFCYVESILFIHFSQKYSREYIESYILTNLPKTLKDKVHLGILALDYKKP